MKALPEFVCGNPDVRPIAPLESTYPFSRGCGAYTPEGVFLKLPEFDTDRLLLAWQEAVFTLYLAEGKIEPEVVENLVLELDAAYSDSSIDFPDQTDQPQELTYVDIDTFLSTF